MSNNQAEEKVKGISQSENQEVQHQVENEKQEEYNLKKLNKKLRATKEKLMHLKERKRALKMKKAPRNKQKKVDKLDGEFQQHQENNEGHNPDFCQCEHQPFAQNNWKEGPPGMIYCYGPWRFHHKHCHHKYNHCNKSEWKRQEFMQCPMKQPRYPPQEQENIPSPPPADEQPQQLQRNHQKCQMKDHKGWGKRWQMPPEWAYFYGRYVQQSQGGDESNSSDSSNYSDNENI